MLNVLIIGNNETDRTYLTRIIGEYSDFNIAASTNTLKNAQNSFENHNVEFIFLFDDFTKIDIFDLVSYWHTEIKIIIISKKPELAARCFEYHNIIDFLIQPLNVARFIKCMAKIYFMKPIKVISKKEKYEVDYTFVKVNKKYIRINHNELLFVEGLKDYTLIRTLYKKYIVHKNIGNFTNHLPRDKFIRIHKSYTVGIDHIETVASNEIEIGPHLIPIGRSYREKILFLLRIKGTKISE